MSVDDTIRTSLEALVEPLEDPDAVVAEVERRQARQRRRRRSSRLLVAATSVAVLAVTGIVVTRDDSSPDRIIAGSPDLTTPTGTPRVHVSSTDLGPLRVSTTDLRSSDGGWLEHTVTIENTGSETIHVNDHRTAQFLGDREVLATDEGCGPGGAQGEPVGAFCQQDLRQTRLEPGERDHFVIVLWRELEGMNPVTSDRLVYMKPIGFRVAPDSDEVVQEGPVGEIALTYENMGSGGWVLPIPASGARAEQLDDGTPVWVVRHDDGSASVLDAVSTHAPFGAGTLVGWCERSRGFEDPTHGSVFDERGGNRGGPAPSGLPTYPSAVAGDTVIVTRPARSPSDRPGGGGDVVGAQCVGSEEGDDPASLVLHSIVEQDAVPLDHAMARPDGAFVLIRGASILLERDEPARVCATVWTSRPPVCTGPEAPELSLFDDRQWALLTGDFVARVGGDTLTDIAYTTSFSVEGPLGE